MFPTARDLPVGNFDFESLAHAAATYQRSPRELLQAARELGIDAVFTMNGIAYFSATISPVRRGGESRGAGQGAGRNR